MPAQSFLAKNGLRTAILGSAASLAIAFGADNNPDAHTAANRTGWYADLTAGSETITSVTGGVIAMTQQRQGSQAAVSISGALRLGTNPSGTTTGGLYLSHAVGNEPFLVFQENGTSRGQIRGVTGSDGVRITNGTSGTTFATFTSAGVTIGDLSLSPSGAITGSAGTLRITGITTFTDNVIINESLELTQGGLLLNERAAVPAAPGAAKGYLWVRNDTPNVLVFTDDAGTDTVLDGGGELILSAIGTDNLGTENLGSFAALDPAAAGNLGVGRNTLSALTTGDGNTALGDNAGITLTTGHRNVIIGESADTGAPDQSDSVIVGRGAAGLSKSVIIGSETDGSIYTDVICLGYGAEATAANQLVIGASTSPITSVYIGEGVTSATPSDLVINATGALGTNIPAANLTIAGGQGTGTGAGGNIIFQTAPAGVTGSTLNALKTVAQITSTSIDMVKGWIQSGKATVTGAGGAPDATADGTTSVYLLDGSTNTCTLALDAAPVNGQRYEIKSINSTNTVTIDRNGNTIDGAASNLTLATNEAVTLIFDTTFGWAII